MKEVLARVRSEMQSRWFVEYFPAMAVWPFTPITVPRKPIEHLLCGQNRRNLLVALAKEGTITLLDHDKQPIDAHRFQWDVSRHPDDQVFIAPSDLEALVVGLLDAPRRAEEAMRLAEDTARQKGRVLIRIRAGVHNGPCTLRVVPRLNLLYPVGRPAL